MKSLAANSGTLGGKRFLVETLRFAHWVLLWMAEGQQQTLNSNVFGWLSISARAARYWPTVSTAALDIRTGGSCCPFLGGLSQLSDIYFTCRAERTEQYLRSLTTSF
ncbi:hypothetical protein CDAR_277391 [Caerostris darwini]|uniref:Secreted protein n=1 Tax=Caerostris darwini TaxID=1538125 RepID=A0AAV4VR07_9ARAC|nr:hypothetical protein CDAR_277391 [Caerostris darwini]